MSDETRELTKEEFLARCANAYDAGFASKERLRLLDKWLDFVLRFEGGQIAYAVDFLAEELRRNGGITGTGAIGKLASDADGYALNQLAAILSHPCQLCATDPDAWWTRAAMCEHKKSSPRPHQEGTTDE